MSGFHETSPGAGFIGFKMTDGDGQVSVETPDTLFLAVHNPQFSQ